MPDVKIDGEWLEAQVLAQEAKMKLAACNYVPEFRFCEGGRVAYCNVLAKATPCIDIEVVVQGVRAKVRDEGGIAAGIARRHGAEDVVVIATIEKNAKYQTLKAVLEEARAMASGGTTDD